jgi:hypothetical protein
MDIDEEDAPLSIDDLEFNYAALSKEYRQNSSPEQEAQFENSIRDLDLEMERLAPNLRALSK